VVGQHDARGTVVAPVVTVLSSVFLFLPYPDLPDAADPCNAGVSARLSLALYTLTGVRPDAALLQGLRGAM